MTCCSSTSTVTPKNYFVENIVDPIGKKLDNHPLIHKVVVAVAHILRMLPMLASMLVLPYSFAVNCTISFAGNLFYRITIERNCAFHFAIPDSLGAMSVCFAIPYLVALAAQSTFSLLAQALASTVPFAIYLGYTVWVSHDEVEERMITMKASTSLYEV